MEVSSTITKFFEQIIKESQKNTDTKNFDEVLKKNTQKMTDSNTSQLQLRNKPNIQHYYSKDGQLLRLAIFKHATQKALESGLKLESQIQQAYMNTAGKEFKWPSEILNTLMQLSFKLIQEQLEREQRRNKKKKKIDLPDGKSEEDALDLLNILFDNLTDDEDLKSFCDWAENSIRRAEQSIREQHLNLPPVVELRFKIMFDAIEALRNGVSPDYIIERLESEIKRKKNNQF